MKSHHHFKQRVSSRLNNCPSYNKVISYKFELQFCSWFCYTYLHGLLMLKMLLCFFYFKDLLAWDFYAGYAVVLFYFEDLLVWASYAGYAVVLVYFEDLLAWAFYAGHAANISSRSFITSP